MPVLLFPCETRIHHKLIIMFFINGSSSFVDSCWAPSFILNDAFVIKYCFSTNRVGWSRLRPIPPRRDPYRRPTVNPIPGTSIGTCTLLYTCPSILFCVSRCWRCGSTLVGTWFRLALYRRYSQCDSNMTWYPWRIDVSVLVSFTFTHFF